MSQRLHGSLPKNEIVETVKVRLVELYHVELLHQTDTGDLFKQYLEAHTPRVRHYSASRDHRQLLGKDHGDGLVLNGCLVMAIVHAQARGRHELPHPFPKKGKVCWGNDNLHAASVNYFAAHFSNLLQDECGSGSKSDGIL